MKVVQLGEKELEFGGRYLTELQDSNDIFDDTDKLRERLREEGYLLIRGLHDREKVLKAREEFLLKLKNAGALAPNAPLDEGAIGEGKPTYGEIREDNSPRYFDVVNSPNLMKFFDRLLGGESMTFDFKWPRAVGHGKNTGVHYDHVFMGRGTENLYTMWTPFGDLPLEMGTLAICLGSQHFEKLKQTYGQMDVDRDNVETGWISNDPVEIVDQFGGQWATTTFRAGDALIFGMYTLHASLNNTTNKYRMSSDTRYQLKSEPKDERWVGENPKGHYAWGKGKMTTVAEAREKWGV